MATPLIGIGVDVHAFGPLGTLRLAGLTWPDEPTLVGHSDGDVAAHAAADALLSAAGLGDLGTVIGVNDAKWDGASGVAILRHVADLLAAQNFVIGNVAVQVIGNRPKLAPRRTEAEQVLGEAIGAPVRISGTTTDSLGLTGRGEGLAAIATALITPSGSRL